MKEFLHGFLAVGWWAELAQDNSYVPTGAPRYV